MPSFQPIAVGQGAFNNLKSLIAERKAEEIRVATAAALAQQQQFENAMKVYAEQRQQLSADTAAAQAERQIRAAESQASIAERKLRDEQESRARWLRMLGLDGSGADAAGPPADATTPIGLSPRVRVGMGAPGALSMRPGTDTPGNASLGSPTMLPPGSSAPPVVAGPGAGLAPIAAPAGPSDEARTPTGLDVSDEATMLPAGGGVGRAAPGSPPPSARPSAATSLGTLRLPGALGLLPQHKQLELILRASQMPGLESFSVPEPDAPYTGNTLEERAMIQELQRSGYTINSPEDLIKVPQEVVDKILEKRKQLGDNPPDPITQAIKLFTLQNMRQNSGAELTPQQSAAANRWADDFMRESDDYFTREDQYKLMRVAGDPKNHTPASDLSMIFAYMKMLDPPSVVREGEQATAQNSRGVPEAIRALYNKLLSGYKLTDSQRADYLEQAHLQYTSFLGKQKRREELYRRRAQGLKIPESYIITPTDPTLVERIGANAEIPIRRK